MFVCLFVCLLLLCECVFVFLKKNIKFDYICKEFFKYAPTKSKLKIKQAKLTCKTKQQAISTIVVTKEPTVATRSDDFMSI